MYFYVVLRKGKELEMGGRKKKKKNVHDRMYFAISKGI